MRTFHMVVVAALGISSAACSKHEETKSTGEDSGAPITFQEPDAFFDLLNLTQPSYPALSEDELVAQSAFIGTGRVTEVREGVQCRMLNTTMDVWLYSLVIQLDVTSVAKGRADDGSVYIEYVHGGAFSVETYRANLPSYQSMVFLIPRVHSDSEDLEYVNLGAGYPAGATLYGLTNPEGWFIDKDGELRQPLVSTDDQPLLFGDAATLREIEAQIADGPDAGPVVDGSRGGTGGV